MASPQTPERSTTKRSGGKRDTAKREAAKRDGAKRETAKREQSKRAATAPSGEATPKQEAAKPKEPKVYVFGGAVGAPQPGANSRRLWKFLSSHLSKPDLDRLKNEIARSQKQEHPDDRFVRWQRIVAACEKLQITYKEGEAEKKITQALVRNLQQQDKGGETGRDAKITIF